MPDTGRPTALSAAAAGLAWNVPVCNRDDGVGCDGGICVHRAFLPAIGRDLLLESVNSKPGGKGIEPGSAVLGGSVQSGASVGRCPPFGIFMTHSRRSWLVAATVRLLDKP